MRYTPIAKDFYIQNRQNLYKDLLPNSVVILISNDVLPKSADGQFQFRQNADTLYLTGIDQEETIVVLFPDSPDPLLKEVLFLRETNDKIALWEGAKLSKEEGKAISGINQVLWSAEFNGLLHKIINMADNVYLNLNEHLRYDNQGIEYADLRFAKAIKDKYPLQHYQRLAPIMHKLRSKKSPLELEKMQIACDITNKAFRRVLNTIKPGMLEYEVEAEIIYEFIRNGAEGHAYTPIIASGASACVLHYITNDKVCNDGDLILMDFGASYGNYAADLTRCIPVNGKFSERQKQVYNAVLNVHKYAASLLIPGMLFKDYNFLVGQKMTEELIGLGLLTQEQVNNQNPESPAYKKYFAHGTSHFLGIDVHDVGYFHQPMQAGNVFTVEPGIYILEEGIGIRLENNYVIQTDGPAFDLMRDIPIEIEEIEALMA